MTQYNNPPVYKQLRAAVCELKQQKNLKIFSIGRSVLGRSIFAIGAGKLRCSTLYVGGVHGQEWLTVLLLLKFASNLSSRKELSAALETRGVIIIPCLNPDGTEIALNGAKGAKELADFVTEIAKGDFSSWQANANGVDLNHNFDAGFDELKKMERESGIVAPAPRQYGGEQAFSEPETKALASLCRLFDVQRAFAFHSQGEEIFYRYGDNTPAESRLMAELLAKASGYRLSNQEGLASHGGFKDWFIDKLHRPAFTIEIGKGKNPLPIGDFEDIYKKLEDMLCLGLRL